VYRTPLVNDIGPVKPELLAVCASTGAPKEVGPIENATADQGGTPPEEPLTMLTLATPLMTDAQR